MKNAIILVCAVSAAISGLFAAFYWYRSSKVNPYPEWSAERPEPMIQEVKKMAINAALVEALAKSAELNKIAALLTAVSVLFGVVSTIVSLFP
jgi:hypothetical protein